MSPTHVSLGTLFKRALHLTREAADQAVKAHGVTAAQYGLLQRLAAYPGSSGAELARMMLITPQAVHQLISSLEKLELIERENDPNHGRIIRCVVTAKGHKILNKCRAAILDMEQELLKPLAPSERDLLVYLLTKYNNREKPNDSSVDDVPSRTQISESQPRARARGSTATKRSRRPVQG